MGRALEGGSGGAWGAPSARRDEGRGDGDVRADEADDGGRVGSGGRRAGDGPRLAGEGAR